MSEELVAPRTESAKRERFEALLSELSQRELDGFLVPRADEHQGEYVPPHAQRLAWLTGFTGSAGLAIVYREQSAIFVDGRYTLQVGDQVDIALFAPQHSADTPPHEWLAANLAAGARIGYDPWLHTPAGVERLAKACNKAEAELVACEDNPLDAVWQDQPGRPAAPVEPHSEQYAGESASSKRERLGTALTAAGIDVAVVTAADSIAWLLNIRGADVERSPLPLSFALLHASGHVDLFLDPRKIGAGLAEHLGNGVTLHSPERLQSALESLGATGKTVQIDADTASAWFLDRLQATKAKIVRQADPCLLPKAIKNEVELAGARRAHHRDGTALCRFLCWLAEHGPSGQIDELSAAAKLHQLRVETGELRDLSFDTISGAGANGAIVHYRVTEQTNRLLEPGNLFLVDSGGQYRDGTTDVTRTVVIGQPTVEQRDRFTRVLKGHIALATARFPKNTSGSQLDVLARLALWHAGLDYDHGTGHGVGSFLCVHEGPHRISKIPNDVALRPGMVVSNEPGYYKTGDYGIRIENLVAVTAPAEVAGGERPMLGFETLTLAPIDRQLIEPELLDCEERDWLNGYHSRVREEIGPALDGPTREWLDDVTGPI